jgi:hypothetical protein
LPVVSSPASCQSFSLSLLCKAPTWPRWTHPPIISTYMLAPSSLGITRAQSLVANAQTEAVTLLRRC